MTLLSRLMAVWPAFHLACMAASAAWLLARPSPAAATTALAATYALPLLAFRVHEWFYPLREGLSRLDEPRYSPWWGGHQIQAVFNAWPGLEAPLRLVPGLYSLWLRLWGSRIGRGVYWTPRVEVLDRSLLDAEDGVVFGHRAECYGHVIKAKDGELGGRRDAVGTRRDPNRRLLLYVRRVTVGAGAFVGAGCRLGPGARVARGSVLPMLTDVYPNQSTPRENLLGKSSRSSVIDFEVTGSASSGEELHAR